MPALSGKHRGPQTFLLSARFHRQHCAKLSFGLSELHKQKQGRVDECVYKVGALETIFLAFEIDVIVTVDLDQQR